MNAPPNNARIAKRLPIKVFWEEFMRVSIPQPFGIV
jgi:hypothetical protein